MRSNKFIEKELQGKVYRWQPLDEAETNEILSAKKITRGLIRAFDILFCCLGLLILLIPFLGIAIWIKIDSKGPVFYRQVRVGKNGKLFRIFKFRSMVIDQKEQSKITLKQDGRITKVGQFIRRKKIDELPQLINVVLGQMSLVGPRPEVPEFVQIYNDAQKQILKIKPGITDKASIEFCDEEKLFSTVEDVEKLYVDTVMPIKIGLNSEYIRNLSVKNYFKLIIKTIFSI